MKFFRKSESAGQVKFRGDFEGTVASADTTLPQLRSRRSSVLLAAVATFPFAAAVACGTSKGPEPVKIGDCYYGFVETSYRQIAAPVRRLSCTDADARLEVVAILGPGASTSCPTHRIGGGVIGFSDVSHSFEEDGKTICLLGRSTGK